MEPLIKCPHLHIRKMISDPEHTKNAVIYLTDQFLRLHKQRYDYEWWLVNYVDGKRVSVAQPVVPSPELLPQFIWSMYYHRSKAIMKHKWSLSKVPNPLKMFGDDPSKARIIISMDGKNYDFDKIKKDLADSLQHRVETANKWIDEFKRLRNKDMKECGGSEITDLEAHELFDGYDLLVQLHMVDCIYEKTKYSLGQKWVDQVKKNMD